jgi:hypothetical protein
MARHLEASRFLCKWQIALVDVVLPTQSATAIRKRCISQPTAHPQILLPRLGLNLPTALERAAM